jgi:hypothetical protein
MNGRNAYWIPSDLANVPSIDIDELAEMIDAYIIVVAHPGSHGTHIHLPLLRHHTGDETMRKRSTGGDALAAYATPWLA